MQALVELNMRIDEHARHNLITHLAALETAFKNLVRSIGELKAAVNQDEVVSRKRASVGRPV